MAKNKRSEFRVSEKSYPDLELPRWMKKPLIIKETFEI